MNEIKEIIDNVTVFTLIRQIWNALEEGEKRKAFIETRYYGFRKLKAFFNLDWKPPQEVYDRLKEYPILQCGPIGRPSIQDLKKEFRKKFDPRNDYVGYGHSLLKEINQ